MNKHLKQDNFIYISQFISPERAKELSKEFKQFVADTRRRGDTQIPESQAAYNYVGFLELLCEQTPQISKFLGETVLPTYTYARVYNKGAELHKHKDREACEISLTLHLDGDNEWPIFIKKPNGEEVSLNLKSGDALMYLGCEAEHWREQFPGNEYVQVFLHYVRSRGPNSFAFFDNARTAQESKLNDSTGIYVPEACNVPETPIAVEKSYSSDIRDYIVVFENLIPDELCDSILNEYKNSQEWTMASTGSGIAPSIRNVTTIQLSTAASISLNPNVRQELDNQLFRCVNTAIIKYNQKFPHAKIEKDTGYELLRYATGQFYVEHTDSFIQQPRAVSCSLALNDDYEGGEFAFFNRELKYKLKKGSVLMFPSNFMYPHEVMPVTNGTRWSIITWFI